MAHNLALGCELLSLHTINSLLQRAPTGRPLQLSERAQENGPGASTKHCSPCRLCSQLAAQLPVAVWPWAEDSTSLCFSSLTLPQQVPSLMCEWLWRNIPVVAFSFWGWTVEFGHPKVSLPRVTTAWGLGALL